MNLPAVAVRTYNTFKEDSGFRKLLKQMGKKLQKLRDPIKRARFVHRKIDIELDKLFEDESVQKLVSCKQGCSACCHTQVAVTEDEAALLAEIVNNGHPIDWTKMFVQANVENSSKEFFQLPYSMRSCIFLDKAGSCTIYEDRPVVCRTNYVVSSPDLCVIENGNEPTVKLLNTFGADSWIYTFFKSNKNNGSLPFMLKRLLKKKRDTSTRADIQIDS